MRLPGTTIEYIYPAYVRGQAHRLAHNANAVAAEFQKLVDYSGHSLYPSGRRGLRSGSAKLRVAATGLRIK